MTINKKCFDLVGVTEKDYIAWCRENKKPAYKVESKREFFRLIQAGRLIKDTSTGKLIKYKRGNDYDN